MKTIIILLVLIPVLTAFPQEICASRDTMKIDNISYIYIDSVTIYNNGINSLIVDSIQCEYSNFDLSIDQFSDSANWIHIEEYFHATNVVEIQPNDSFQVRIKYDAILVKIKQMNYTQVDTIYFYNNSTNMPIFPMVIIHTMITEVLESEKIKVNFNLYQNYPNPFNPTTKIRFDLPKASNVNITIYNILGKSIHILFDKYFQAGSHLVEFDASYLPNGIYFYHISAGRLQDTKKMLLIK